ncbi:hypothetical protein Nepgr_022450 [Nepenthes gracilis]|uniref:Protein FRA10AC1 n=1 Tax=Nepenthes gracilis TaxID=150966 RepID=A0AAD3XY34_NEPGR|nr:hypothetical protein Nepgr_022450 [Nepenthes gracilis]
MASFRSLKSAIFDREERKQQYQAYISGLNAYDRHKKFLNDYVCYYGKARPSGQKFPVKTDQDTLREGYRFIRTEEDDMDTSWEQRLVKRYYDKLFKEYCIAEMSKYKRWQEKEVVSGKGQFICGNKHCSEKKGLTSYEVNFSYIEAGESKQALVKLVTCERCAEKLHYRRMKEKKQLERKEKGKHTGKGERSRSDDETDDAYEQENCRKRKGSELSENKEKEVHRRKRKRSKSVDTIDEEFQKSKEKEEKGKWASASAADHGDRADEDFDRFLEGMFP